MAGERILVVDDNPANAKLAAFVLSRHGFQVVTAQNAAAALASIAAQPPALVLMDLQMPGVDGLTLTRQLRDDPATRHLPIVAVTAYAMRGDEQRALDAGCNGYLTKPINTKTFAGQISAWLQKDSP